MIPSLTLNIIGRNENVRILIISTIVCNNLVVAPTLLVNAARDMAADQSSSPPLGGAMRAVDGNTSATWWHHTCSYTDREQNPWWRVDLVRLYDVWHVGVTNFEQRKYIDILNSSSCCAARV